MARTATAAARKAPKPSGRQGVWDAIRRSGAGFTPRGIAAETDISAAVVRQYVRTLVAGGFVRKAPMTQYVLARDVGVDAPRLAADGSPSRRGLRRENLWRTMRILSKRGDFTARELCLHARTEEVWPTLTDVKRLVGRLVRVGYLVATVKGRAHTAGRYRLIRNTGPKPPSILNATHLYDHNLRRVVAKSGDLQ